MDKGIDENTADWPQERRVALVLSILKGEVSAREAARSHGLTLAQVEGWKTQFLAAAEDALAAPAADEPVDTSEKDEARADAAGIWICSLSEQSLAPVLFMQAACAGRLPTETSIKWTGEHRSPKPFRRSGFVSLLRGECGIIPLVGHPLHVYSTRLVETVPFERDSALSDWELPVPIAGIVALVENRPSQETTARLFRAIKPAPSRALTWIMAQELPWVIAAVGYDDENISEDTFRELYKLPSYVPIIPGPSPLGAGLMSFLTGRGRNLRFDSAYAKQVLGVLTSRIRRS